MQYTTNAIARWRSAAAALCCSALVACGGGESSTAAPVDGAATPQDIDTALRALLMRHGVAAPARPAPSDAMFNLGLNLFQSTLLSGNQKVSCASCHPIGNAGVDNLRLAIGVNGSGNPPSRAGTPVVHRNTIDLLNKAIGGRRFLFWDGRVGMVDGTFVTPAGDRLPAGLADLAAAQALFPLLSRSEMLGDYDLEDSNTLADLNPPGAVVEHDPQPVWEGLMARLRADAGMAALLRAAHPGQPLEAIGIAAVGNALAAYQSRRWYGFGSTNVLHAYQAGARDLTEGAKRGGLLFFGKARCAGCHTGELLSDQRFHNLAVPQIGPGFGSGAAMLPPRDLGRYDVTGADADRYAFLTPSLWEVAHTFPYLHNGVYTTLEDTIRHHLDPATAALAFRCPQPLTESGNTLACADSSTAPALYDDMVARLAPALRTPVSLTEAEIADLVAFLGVLTDGNNNSVR